MTAVLITIVAVLLMYICVSYILFRIAVVRRPEKSDELFSDGDLFSQQICAGLEWIKARNCEKVEILSYDNLKLSARILTADNARGTIILMHGYRSPLYRDFACVYEYFHSLGFNLLIASQRAHGESEGKYICYGVKERYDCKKWIEYACSRFGGNSDIFLDGLSMGCSTVLMASNLDLPENVRGILADCGFTSVRDEFAYLVRNRAHLPPEPFLWGVNIFTRLIAGFNLDECSAAGCVAESKIPVLFVHGSADDFVPIEFTRTNYEACAGEKKLVIVDGAGHGVSYLVDTPGCQHEIEAFFERYSTCGK